MLTLDEPSGSCSFQSWPRLLHNDCRYGYGSDCAANTVLNAQLWGQTRCPVNRSGTLNVQRSTLNVQRGGRKGAWWGGIWGQTRDLRVSGANRGTGTIFNLNAQLWGQTRCPVNRSGTLNVQRSTLNVQRGDRKGAWWGGTWGQTRDFGVSGANRGTGTIFNLT